LNRREFFLAILGLSEGDQIVGLGVEQRTFTIANRMNHDKAP